MYNIILSFTVSEFLSMFGRGTPSPLPRSTMGILPLHARTPRREGSSQALVRGIPSETLSTYAADTTLGHILLWLSNPLDNCLLEAGRWTCVYLAQPFVQVLRSGYDMVVYLNTAAREEPVRAGATLSYLQSECTRLSLSQYLKTAITVRGDAVTALQPSQLLEVLDEVIAESSGESCNEVKRLMRLQFLLTHMCECEADHFNVYAAAYINPYLYGTKALLTIALQIFSFVVLYINNRHTAHTLLEFSNLNATLIILFIVWLIYIIPGLLLPNTLSRNTLLAYIFYREDLKWRAFYTCLDILNQSLVTLMPVLAALTMMASKSTLGIVFNSLSVLFVIRLDESAFSSGEKVYLRPSLLDMMAHTVSNLDTYSVPSYMWVLGLLPLVEVAIMCGVFVWTFFIML